jgi:hypothetical protein
MFGVGKMATPARREPALTRPLKLGVIAAFWAEVLAPKTRSLVSATCDRLETLAE